MAQAHGCKFQIGGIQKLRCKQSFVIHEERQKKL